MSDHPLHAQDAYARLVEDCRLGLVRRMVMRSRPNRTEYIPFRPDVDLITLPVFDLGVVDHRKFDIDGLEATLAGKLHLPYSRCGFLYRGLGGPESQARVPIRHRKETSRWYFMLADETDDGIQLSSFVRHDDHPRWCMQTWQATVTAQTITVAYDPAAIEEAAAEFMAALDRGVNDRIAVWIGDVWSIVRPGSGGTVAPGSGGTVTDLANKRRGRDGLPPVPSIRVLKFDSSAPERRTAQPSPDGAKTQRAPHFRHGTWRTLPTGREVWVRASAIHGGTPDAPPWYEVERGIAK